MEVAVDVCVFVVVGGQYVLEYKMVVRIFLTVQRVVRRQPQRTRMQALSSRLAKTLWFVVKEVCAQGLETLPLCIHPFTQSTGPQNHE